MLSRYLNLVILGLCSTVILLSSIAQPSAQAQDAPICFNESPYCITGRIAEFWQQNGGLTVFGLPITDQQGEVIEGQSLQVQWFERNRLELHPENQPPYDVLIGRLGDDLLKRDGRDWFAFPQSEPIEGCAFFADTNHNVCGDILALWRSQGIETDGEAGISAEESLALFGLPLSDEMEETLSDGQTYTVQWFERARFELHPENQPPYNVLLGLLGREILESPGSDDPTPDPTPSPDPVSDERIVFQSNRDGNREIYVMNLDGSGQTNLTNHPARDENPTWSPDGTRIAFESDRDGPYNIYIMNADGTGVTRITDSEADDEDPAWSPDGASLSFLSNLRNGGLAVAVVPADGSAQADVIGVSPNSLFFAWQPNSAALLLHIGGSRFEGGRVTTFAPGDSQPGLELADPGFFQAPAWSVDGASLFYVAQPAVEGAFTPEAIESVVNARRRRTVEWAAGDRCASR
ncbi:MAG: hypothetical protein HC837_10740, partial [Chloroflexaceae bacterium]|nr:hypothetical protein [Chloroflexaceae bacterium]